MENLSKSNLSLSEQSQLERLRNWKDRATTWAMGFGGISVIIVILLIFFYLFYIALPLFFGASLGPSHIVSNPELGRDETFHLAVDEHNEIGVRFTTTGRAQFFRLADGALIDTKPLLEPDQIVTGQAVGDAFTHQIGIGLADGTLWLTKAVFDIHFDVDKRRITPSWQPLYPEPLEIHAGQAVRTFAFRDGEEYLTVASTQMDRQLVIARFSKEVSFLDESVELERTRVTIALPAIAIEKILIGPNQRWLYLLSRNSDLLVYDIAELDHITGPQQVRLAPKGDQVTQLQFLTGAISLMVGTQNGVLSQWFMVRDAEDNHTLTRIRTLQAELPTIAAMTTEHRRKGLIVADDLGRIAVLHSTSESLLIAADVDERVRMLAVSPRADVLLLEQGAGRYRIQQVENEHPEISWRALWGKVWYESYQEPDYVWQSSAADNDFEPKLSLTPLSFGTLKAALYAMMIAIPLALMGAIYTAYFMAPKMRAVVKPTIEIMEALPTVVLGFLAGLWLAPLVERYMPAIFSLLLLLPFAIFVFGYCWQCLPERLRHLVPEGWYAMLLIPVVLLAGYAAFASSHVLEALFFDGDMRAWVDDRIGYDQRNALIVGFAMGFAVIPTIFSIAEDAIFSAPRHLTDGSLALGATTWQTMVHVVLPTASPGIFSAVMMGFGRAVGETMIVLMATGNTPIMNMNIFEGMRTLAANIAVEMPEAEVASTHYRVLFLAALVLFMFTFVLNTIAEIVRQRLRNKYGKI